MVGDLHGQLADLLHIFKRNGWPSAESLYVFNGELAAAARAEGGRMGEGGSLTFAGPLL